MNQSLPMALPRTARSALCAALLLAAASASRAQDWDFQVFLDDAPIGYHRYTLREQGAERELKSEARFDVKLLFINAYRYAHEATERWRGNCIDSLAARTNDGGKRIEVTATQEGGRLAIDTPRGQDVVDGCVMSFAYWNPEILRQPRLLNAQTGEYAPVQIAALGEEKITVRGTPVMASRYRITGTKHSIDLWYSADRTWLALQSTLEGGRRLRYQLK
jgi:Family of unknown function (DUF6134)